jgi:hypothetical protein
VELVLGLNILLENTSDTLCTVPGSQNNEYKMPVNFCGGEAEKFQSVNLNFYGVTGMYAEHLGAFPSSSG